MGAHRTDAQAHLPGSLAFVREFIRLRIAQALVGRGQAGEALRYLRSLGQGPYPVVAPALLAEGQAHEALGDTAAARAAYQRFVRWWDRPDRALMHLKDEAEAALARLGG